MTNKLIVIGWLGDMKAYLNVTKEKALTRYAKIDDITLAEAETHIRHEFEFEDEFNAYDVYPKYD